MGLAVIGGNGPLPLLTGLRAVDHPAVRDLRSFRPGLSGNRLLNLPRRVAAAYPASMMKPSASFPAGAAELSTWWCRCGS